MNDARQVYPVCSAPGDFESPPAISPAVLAIDLSQPVYHVKTLNALVSESTIPSQASARLSALFGAPALLLAAIGAHGVVAYGVKQQTREFAVRMALGATTRDVRRQVLRSGGAMVGTGLVLGLAASLGAARLLRGVLVGVTPADPATFLGVAALLAVVGLAACGVPAWRALRTRPMNALRAE